jgi:pilus assembly protein CpaE
MNAIILSDDQAAAERLRSALAACDVDCPIDRVRSLGTATSLLGGSEQFDAIFLMLTENESGLTLLEDLCSRSGMPIVAVGAARDPRFILRVVHAGPTDYLDIDGDLARELPRALSRLQPVDRGRTAVGKLISIFSHCGGSGCSLVAANLAVGIAELRQECLLFDLNIRRGDLATLLNLKPVHTINDVVKNASKLQPDMFRQALTKHGSGVQMLAAPASFSDVRPIPVEAMTQIVSLGRKTYPFLVADLEDFFHPEQFEVLRQSDTVLFVLRLDYTALRNARRTFDFLERDGVESARFTLVVNQYGRPRELTSGQAEDVLGRPLDYFIPCDPKVAIESLNRGVPIVQSAPRTPIGKALKKMAENVVAAAATVTV